MTKGRAYALAVVACALVVGACEQSALSSLERSLLMPMVKPAMPPVDATNAFIGDPEAVALGHRLYFDKRFSGPLAIGTDTVRDALGAQGEIHKVACVACHSLDAGAADRRRELPTSLGSNYTGRHSPSVFYIGENGPYFSWDGHRDSVWNQSLVPMESGAAHNTSRLYVVRVLVEEYANDWESVFGDVAPLPSFEEISEWNEPKDASGALRCPPRTSGVSCFCTNPDDIALGTACPPPSSTVRGRAGSWEWEALSESEKRQAELVYAHFAKALDAYLRTLRPYASPFDRFMAGDEDALTPSAIRGAQLFVGKASCNECHRGPTFTDGSFHNIGVPQDVTYTLRDDDGRAEGLRRLLTPGISAFSVCSDLSDETRTLDDDGRLTACGQRTAGLRACTSDDDCIDVAVPCADGAPVVTGVCGERRSTCFLENSSDGSPGVCVAPSDKGAFKVPTLRNVAVSAPYMHNGTLSTLWDVVDFYNGANGTDGFPGEVDVAIAPLGLDPDEVNDLVAFLGSLTDDLGDVDEEHARWFTPPLEAGVAP